jgi:hypothetical protein
MFERCIGLVWCPGCRIYVSSLGHVARARVLVDALAALPAERRERLLGSESRLVAFLDRQVRGGRG